MKTYRLRRIVVLSVKLLSWDCWFQRNLQRFVRRERERESSIYIWSSEDFFFFLFFVLLAYVTHFIKKRRCKIWLKWNVLRKVKEKDKKKMNKKWTGGWEKRERIKEKKKKVSGLGKAASRKYKKPSLKLLYNIFIIKHNKI